MDQTVFLITCLILAPLTAHFRQWKPAALFAATALIYALFGSINLINTYVVLSSIGEPKSHLNDTYYVVNSGNSFFSFSLILMFFAALTWLQSRLGAMRFPRVTRALFWPLNLGLIGASSSVAVLNFLVPKPRRYIDYPEYIDALNRISSLATICSSIASLALVCLFIWSFALGRKLGRSDGHEGHF